MKSCGNLTPDTSCRELRTDPYLVGEDARVPAENRYDSCADREGFVSCGFKLAQGENYAKSFLEPPCRARAIPTQLSASLSSPTRRSRRSITRRLNGPPLRGQLQAPAGPAPHRSGAGRSSSVRRQVLLRESSGGRSGSHSQGESRSCPVSPVMIHHRPSHPAAAAAPGSSRGTGSAPACPSHPPIPFGWNRNLVILRDPCSPSSSAPCPPSARRRCPRAPPC